MSIRFACRSPRVRTLLYAIAALFLLFGPGLRAAAAQVSTVVGTGEDGSLYAIDMPAQWNGELVVYAHGIVDPAAPVALPTTQDGSDLLRARITGMGYAIAYSSFSDNGYSLKSAIQRTHQLRGAFATTFGQPGRTYLVGHSLGGLAVLALAETYPGQYAGALPMCSPLGGGTAEIQYLGNGRVLFDYFFPSAVPGGPFTVPQGTSFAPGSPAFNAALGALVGGLSAPGQPTLQFASAAKLPFRSVAELINSGMSVVGFSVRFTNDVLDRTSGHIPYENRGTLFSGSANDAALNAGVERFAGTPDAVNYFKNYYTPTGDLRIPVLTLHTLFDPVAPFAQEAGYARVVQQAGASALLAQRSVTSYGHCNINTNEAVAAFSTLVAWANGGPSPAPLGDGTIRP
jgi:pimeloyl-ACP methyl ester carboxylesterase